MTATPDDLQTILTRIQHQAASEEIRITQHAQQEMIAEAIALDDVLYSLSNGSILENYPSHRRGPCCLVNGVDRQARHIHVVCTTAAPRLIIITAYLPLPPKWITPIQRRSSP